MTKNPLATGNRLFIPALLGASIALSGCVTRSAHRRAIEEVRTTQAAEAGRLRTEVESLRADVTALRSELQTMRTEFQAQITALEEGLQFALPIHFAFDDATLREQDKSVVDRIIQVAQRLGPEVMITVIGYTDPRGSAAHNRALSERRAQAVRTYMISGGLAADRVRAVGWGAANPVVPGAGGDQPGAEANRRVVFVLETRGTPVGDADGLDVNVWEVGWPIGDGPSKASSGR